MAKLTASASGTNRKRATPLRKNMGTKTMQMQSVETNAGTAICCAPSRMACRISLPMARLRSMFSISTVASSTRMPTASASPPRVMMLSVSPMAAKREDGTEDGERNRNRDDDGGTPVAEEEQNHHRRQRRRQQRLVQHALNGGAHEQRLIEQRADLQLRRQRLRRQGDDFLDSGDDLQRGGLAVLVNRHQSAAVAVLAHDVGLRRKAVADVGHVAHVERGAVAGLHRQIVQLGDGLRRAVHLHVVFQRAELDGSGGKNQILRIDGVDDVDRGKVVGLQLRQVQIHLDLPDLSAVRIRRGRALHRGQRVAQEVLAQIEELLLGQSSCCSARAE